ncbi:unnamed protein product [Urochloa humidicola]
MASSARPNRGRGVAAGAASAPPRSTVFSSICDSASVMPGHGAPTVDLCTELDLLPPAGGTDEAQPAQRRSIVRRRKRRSRVQRRRRSGGGGIGRREEQPRIELVRALGEEEGVIAGRGIGYGRVVGPAGTG